MRLENDEFSPNEGAGQLRMSNQAEIIDAKRWLKKAAAIQWDYKNIVKRKGVLEKLK